MSPAVSLFMSLLLLSTYLGLTASNWLTLWTAMELNTLVFIPLIAFYRSGPTADTASKYFAAQSVGSLLFLLSAGASLFPLTTPLASSLLLLALLVKGGIAPVHHWFPATLSMLPWSPALMLLTWQKFLPLLLLINLTALPTNSMLFLVGALNALVGAAGGLDQTQLRPLLAYSSLSHMGWALSISPLSTSAASLYFLLYTLLVAPLGLIYLLGRVSSIKITAAFSQMAPPLLLVHTVALLSLGGMPPLTGFYLKGAALQLLLSHGLTLLAILLVLSATASLAYYLNLVFLALLMPFLTLSPDNTLHPTNTLLGCFTLFSTLALPLLLQTAITLGAV